MSLTKVSHSMIQNSVFDVVDYGADPTGSLPSNSAIQAAIDAAAAGGGTVYIPVGTYKLNSGLTVSGCVTIQSPSDNARAYLKITGNFTALTLPNAASGSIITGLTIDADQKNTSTPLVIVEGTNYTISNCWFLYSAYHAVQVGTVALPTIATRFYNNRVIGSNAAISNNGSGFDFQANINTTSCYFYSNYISSFKVGIYSIYNTYGGGFGNIVEGCSTGIRAQNRDQVWVCSYFEINTVEDYWIGDAGATLIGSALGAVITFQSSTASTNSAIIRQGFGQFGTNGFTPNAANIGGYLTVNSAAIGATVAPRIGAGSGSPEGVLAAPVGSLYMRTDGGAGTSFYVKESGTGNTGWVAK